MTWVVIAKGKDADKLGRSGIIARFPTEQAARESLLITRDPAGLRLFGEWYPEDTEFEVAYHYEYEREERTLPDEIPPALTPEEWRLVQMWRAGKMPGGRVRGAHVMNLPDDGHVAATMAFANAWLPDGDPRKITFADVDELRERAARDPIGVDEGGRDIPDPSLTAIADKLESLLPPDVTTYTPA